MSRSFNYDRLVHILGTCRAGGSEGEKLIIDQYIRTIDGVSEDSYGNLHVEIGAHNGVMFSCHTDTVHAIKDPVYQEIGLIEDHTLILMDKGKVLGADDGVGMEIMLTMIEHKVPGLYVFHRDEERGGGGSSHIAKEEWLLEGITKCIAFDRKGFTDVITHQFGMRCCSDEFAQELSRCLNLHDDEFEFEPDNGGTFTDSANYTHLVSECTNLAVGYLQQHTSKESTSLVFLDKLVSACVKLDWNALPAKRDPDTIEYDDYGYGGYGTYGMYGGYGNYRSCGQYKKKGPDFDNWYSIYDWVVDNPSEAADLLYDTFESYTETTRQSSGNYSDNGISLDDPGSYSFED